MPATPVLRFLPPLAAPVTPVVSLTCRAQPATSVDIPLVPCLEDHRRAPTPSYRARQVHRGTSVPHQLLRAVRSRHFSSSVCASARRPQVQRKTPEQQQNTAPSALRLFYPERAEVSVVVVYNRVMSHAKH